LITFTTLICTCKSFIYDSFLLFMILSSKSENVLFRNKMNESAAKNMNILLFLDFILILLSLQGAKFHNINT